MKRLFTSVSTSAASAFPWEVRISLTTLSTENRCHPNRNTVAPSLENSQATWITNFADLLQGKPMSDLLQMILDGNIYPLGIWNSKFILISHCVRILSKPLKNLIMSFNLIVICIRYLSADQMQSEFHTHRCVERLGVNLLVAYKYYCYQLLLLSSCKNDTQISIIS